MDWSGVLPLRIKNARAGYVLAQTTSAANFNWISGLPRACIYLNRASTPDAGK